MTKPTLMTTEAFVKRAKAIHGDLYDYSKVEYVNATTKVTITDPEHGDFDQAPAKHLTGCGCPERSKIKVVDLG